MTSPRIFAASTLVIAGLICLLADARACRWRAERDAYHARLGVDEYVPFETSGTGIAGFIAGMTCLILAAAIVS